MYTVGLGVMAYWLFRTPAEVIKTQVQTGQLPSVADAVAAAKLKYSSNWLGLWKHYTVMLGLDIPFQIMNFILYGSLSEAVTATGIAPSVWTRLFCGASCGMVRRILSTLFCTELNKEMLYRFPLR